MDVDALGREGGRGGCCCLCIFTQALTGQQKPKVTNEIQISAQP